MLHISHNIPLDELNTFAVNAKANSFVQIDALSQLNKLKDLLIDHPQRLILGGGSNILFTKDYSGLVIYPQLKGIVVVNESETEVTIKVAASENWHNFVRYCVAHGYYGLENLALIPGTVGAAPVQNIGAYGVEVEHFIKCVECYDFETFQSLIFSNKECQFNYRDSVFKRAKQVRYLVIGVEFVLSKIPNCIVTYKPLKEYFESQADFKNQEDRVTPQQVFDRVCEIRKDKLPNPDELANAGSFFKNPIIRRQHYAQLVKRYPDIVVYPVRVSGQPAYKVAAGWLIERAGFKGKRYDKIGVYSKQALVLVNYSDEKGSNILKLAHRIIREVKQLFEIVLEAEVKIIE